MKIKTKIKYLIRKYCSRYAQDFFRMAVVELLIRTRVMRLLKKEYSDKFSPIIENKKNSDTLIISFGGMAQNLGLPPFEFLRSLDTKKHSTILLRDFRQSWYQMGIVGYGKNVKEVAEYLKKRIKDGHYKKVVTLGTSAGGYAAILFGGLLKVDSVISFAPRIKVTDNAIDQYHNKMSIIGRKLKRNNNNQYILDLESFIRKETDLFSEMEIAVYIGEKNIHDVEQISKLSFMKNLNVFKIQDTSEHNIPKIMRDNGTLKEVLDDI